MIRESDVCLLDAFLRRELADYCWKQDGLDVIRQSIVFLKWKGEILGFVHEGADYVEIMSLTNMGLVDRVLKLTAEPWKPGEIISANLPPHPHGGINIRRVK